LTAVQSRISQIEAASFRNPAAAVNRNARLDEDRAVLRHRLRHHQKESENKGDFSSFGGLDALMFELEKRVSSSLAQTSLLLPRELRGTKL
jgi:hypothetical protein